MGGGFELAKGYGEGIKEKTFRIGNMGYPTQTTTVIALALGVNPILDMFETMNNVTGDLACTYVVAKTEGLIEE